MSHADSSHANVLTLLQAALEADKSALARHTSALQAEVGASRSSVGFLAVASHLASRSAPSCHSAHCAQAHASINARTQPPYLCVVQVLSLQERGAALLAELEEARASASRQRAEAALAGGGGGFGGGAAVGAGGDKEVLLRHIDSLKEVKGFKAAVACI